MRDRLGLLLRIIFLVAPVTGWGGDLVVPAGTLLQCTVSEPNFSSKTAEIDDPLLCRVGLGRSVLPYGTFLVGRFAEYRDPGHFIGKGWMQLNFDRIVLPSQVLPLSAKVVYMRGLTVDRKGRIHGQGHARRDVVEWSIPLLWPMKVATLPMRGPRPRLTNETRITFKVMDDLVVPGAEGATNALPTSTLRPGQFTLGSGATAPEIPNGRFTNARAAVETSAVRGQVQTAALRSSEQASGAKELTLLILKGGKGNMVTAYWFEGGQRIRFISVDGAAGVIPIESLDLGMTVEINRQRGVEFVIRSENTEDKD
jgi:hypothetical protein